MIKKISIVGQKHQDLDPYLPGIHAGSVVTLVREPNNPVDKNAVACWIDGRKVGYLPAKDNPKIAAAIDTARADDASVQITGILRRSPNSGYPQVEIEI